MPSDPRSPLHPVQLAIHQRLTGDDILMNLVTGVFDQVPEDQPHPYVRIGEHLSVPDNTHDSFGREVTVTLHVWTRARGNATGQAIADRVGVLLDHQPLTVEGHRAVSVRQEFDQALRDPDPEVRHHVMRFRVTTTQG
jgi:hypothetical protein